MCWCGARAGDQFTLAGSTPSRAHTTPPSLSHLSLSPARLIKPSYVSSFRSTCKHAMPSTVTA